MSATVTVRARQPLCGSVAKALTSDSAAHNVRRMACRASGPLHQMPAASSRLRRVVPFGQKKRRSCYTFSDETRKEERTTWESIAKNRPHVRRRSRPSAHNRARVPRIRHDPTAVPTRHRRTEDDAALLTARKRHVRVPTPSLTAARVGNPMRSPDGHRHEVAQGGVSGI